MIRFTHIAERKLETGAAFLGNALRAGDGCTYAHSSRLIHYALTVGGLLALSDAALLTLKYGVFLHDIGKLHVDGAILAKPGPLSDAEWSVMRRHPASGYGMVRAAGLPDEVARIILTHHEWYDGTGYPRGMSGPDIPLAARICAAVDTMDALTSPRSYRRPISFEEALAEVRAGSGTHFDPMVVEACLAVAPDEWARLRSQPDDPLSSFADLSETHSSAVPISGLPSFAVLTSPRE
jgi:HD-GYP domain-containing protein (c-di-GMP phosphodiesterase class II)